MSRIESVFANLKSDNKKALIPYITAGDGGKALTVPLMHAMVEAGADILELGVPFSDPMADGPVIQKACERALSVGTTLKDVLAMVAAFREQDSTTPVVLMGYLNPVEAMGYEAFAEACVQSGVDGVLLVDLPPEEASSIRDFFVSRQLDMIFLLAPTTTELRMDAIAKSGSGYLYYVSLKGVTGAATLDVDAVKESVETIRKHTELPIGVGFGIKDAKSAQAVSAVSDGVVVGSVLVNLIAEYAGDSSKVLDTVSGVLKSMRTEMDSL